MKVHWTARAEIRLDAIHAYIAQENPAAGLRIAQRILQRSSQIAEFPASGHRVPDYDRNDVRELIEGNYRIVYRLLDDRIDVLTVMHCAQLLPSDLSRL